MLPNLFLLLSTVTQLAFSQPHGPAIPRLMGRRGLVDVETLPSARSALIRRAPIESPDNTCGGTNGYTCPKSSNRCCSQYGYCGDSPAHCTSLCQPAFGLCGTDLPPATDAGECGAKNGGKKCPENLCCSEDGSCGDDEDSCMAPYCQVGFGRCDADYVPSGESTEGVGRELLGNVKGDDIYDCVHPGEIALTFDDGPDIYTDSLLTLLSRFSAKATFFLTGINNSKGAIDSSTTSWPTIIKRMHSLGHHIASHTWSHRDLSLISEAERKMEIIKLEMALRNVLGFFPTYLRPPYSSCDAACGKTVKNLGYRVVYFDLDTDDYNHETREEIQVSLAVREAGSKTDDDEGQVSKDIFAKALSRADSKKDNFLVIAHDIHEQTATNLTQYILTTLQQKGYKAVTLGQCLGDPSTNWYRSASTGPATPTAKPSTPTTTPTSPTITKSLTVPTRTPTTIPGTDGNAGGCSTLKVGNFCAKPLGTWSTTSQCQNVAQNCLLDATACGGRAKCQEYLKMCGGIAGYCASVCGAGGSGGGNKGCPYIQVSWPR